MRFELFFYDDETGEVPLAISGGSVSSFDEFQNIASTAYIGAVNEMKTRRDVKNGL